MKYNTGINRKVDRIAIAISIFDLVLVLVPPLFPPYIAIAISTFDLVPPYTHNHNSNRNNRDKLTLSWY